MTRIIGKVALTMIVSAMMLTTGKATANFSAVDLSLIPTKTEFLYAVSSERANDDSEKLISNVKVFYNPIADQVTLNFKLNKQNTVAIKVMDALGNEVLNLMNGRLDDGLQSLSFDANGKLTAGFYFVRVTSGTEVIVKRISVR
ncbi:T9SS type A sorting domain-containing protein [Sphingobacterium wenxiniae]|uniref:Por secretion system C-terminal sorting domain-containing protein n=1 Tax=Sphingobacterium wenxiniae TaxID=683125 RepID=A0A1I6TSB2_9SPHI|nr:T9SS type A sorting domain-containing protein [Sphingobacterium wenxiniae]SFS92050.1 Por secretion system C-terminal sorting domain-containing protein [Sphingobacterium wenxiniae]